LSARDERGEKDTKWPMMNNASMIHGW